MRNVHVIFLLLLLAFAVENILIAQPAGERTNQQASSDTSAAARLLQQEERSRIEKKYLLQAKQNIEKYRKGNASLAITDEEGKPLKNIQIEINQISQDFLFGNTIFEIAGFAPKLPYKTDLFKERFKALFNFAVLPFYWSGYEQIPGKPEWKKNQDAIEWCLQNDIVCKGHPLGWTSPSGTPKWLMRMPVAQTEELYKARIVNNVVGMKGQINMWDVVNEPVNTVPWEKAMTDTANNNDFRYNMNNVQVSDIVPWVEKSFKWANEANPDGNYILNEYFTLAIPAVRDRFYDLIKELKSRKTPVKGIGIQAHEPREMWFSPVEMYKTFDKYKEFNLPIHITELIPQSSGKNITGWRSGIWTEQAQAEFSEQFYTLAFGHPSIASINWWGLSDKNIWLKGGGLLDEEYNPKPVYHSLMKLIKSDWMTKNIKVVTDKKGEAAFRGFFGKYEIVVKKADGSIKSFNVHLREKESNNWTFKISPQ